MQPISQSVSTYDHDKLCGILWAEWVDRFYKKVSEAENTKRLLADWHDQTDGWVPENFKRRLTSALESWSSLYPQKFSPEDGCRNGSEKYVENDRFVGYLDGLSHDGVVHEVKSTSRAKSVSEQLWVVQNSIQVKLYCVLARATGICIEFAYKDAPIDIFRAPVIGVTPEQLKCWEQELNALADSIYALGDDPCNYPCHPNGCIIVTKNFTGQCSYQALCAKLEGAEVGYKEKEHRKR